MVSRRIDDLSIVPNLGVATAVVAGERGPLAARSDVERVDGELEVWRDRADARAVHGERADGLAGGKVVAGRCGGRGGRGGRLRGGCGGGAGRRRGLRRIALSASGDGEGDRRDANAKEESHTNTTPGAGDWFPRDYGRRRQVYVP